MHKHGGDIYRNQGVVDYSANINFRGMPESVRQAAKDAIDASVCYPDPQCEELKAAIAEKENVPAEWIFCGNGAADVIFSLVLALKPQKALLPIPSFYEYRQALESVGCQISETLLKEDEAFCLPKRFVNEIPMDTDMVCLCNPNNPTGQLLDREVLEQVADYCQTTDTCLLLDDNLSRAPSVRNGLLLFLLLTVIDSSYIPEIDGITISIGKDDIQQLRRILELFLDTEGEGF